MRAAAPFIHAFRGKTFVLGFGGEVAGDAIRCPFHGWEYKADGWCKHIPYATQMPPKCQSILAGQWYVHP